jgi:hypothetical protein
MNLICVAPWCGGALIADLLNNEQSPFETSVLISRYNHILKVDMQDPDAIEVWQDTVKKVSSSLTSKGKYYSTHLPIKYIYSSLFEHFINITIETEKSKWYRFLRMYYLSINGQKSLKEELLEEVMGLVHICKSDVDWISAELDNVENIELEDVIEGRFVDQINGNKEHFARWTKRNSFLFIEQDPETVKLWETCT